MSERGVFAVDRGIFDHPVLNSRAPFSRREAWLWLVSEAAWKPRSFRANGRQVDLKRGQLSHSVRFLAEKWNWSKSAVGRFLDVLQTETMIEKETGTGQILISICNFDQYQRVSLPNGTGTGTATGTGAGQQRDKEEDIKGIESNSDSGGGLFGDQPEGKKPRKNPWPRDYRDKFWQPYPLKVSKKAALELLERIFEADKISFDDIVNGIDAYKRSKPPDRDWMHPTTFLRNERWNDEHGDQQTRKSNEYRTGAPRGGEAIIAGVRDVTAQFSRRYGEGPDAAEGFGPDGQGSGRGSDSDLELPLRAVGSGS